jgi:hypothetical protein
MAALSFLIQMSRFKYRLNEAKWCATQFASLTCSTWPGLSVFPRR